MTRDRIDIDPALLRDQAEHHNRAADNIRQWVEPPVKWLANFPSQYGRIAGPVHNALENYYSARQKAGNALADRHVATAKALQDAADAYERADSDGAAAVRGAFDGFDDTAPTAGRPSPADPAQPNPSAQDNADTGAPDSADTVPTSNGTAPTTGLPSASQDATPAMAGAPTTDSAAIPQAPTAEPSATHTVLTNLTDTAPQPRTDVRASSPSTAAAGIATPSNGATGKQPATPASSGHTGASRRSAQSPTQRSFAAAVSAAKVKASDISLADGSTVNEDLIMARTLLGSVLAAVGSPAVPASWAVSVMRGPGGPRLFITSNEGRGWLPAGLFLPQNVSTPWIWSEFLDPGPSSAASAWEAIADPARILAEFAQRWGVRINAHLSALVSSEPIDHKLRSRLDNVAVEGSVQPSLDVDLRVPHPESIDRLGLTGSADSLEQLAALTDEQAKSRSVELAQDGHARAGRFRSRPGETSALPGLRDRILATIQAGFEVPTHWWQELRQADDNLAAWIVSHRDEASRVVVGNAGNDDSSTLRGAMFQRRCNELVLLLANEPTRQRLRDVVYAHEQIVNHPMFTAPAVSPPEAVRGERTPATAPPVPNVTAAPPTSATADCVRPQSATSPVLPPTVPPGM